VISDKLAAARVQIKSGEDVQRAAEAVAASLSPFRQALVAGPERLRKSIAEFVARGRAVVGATGDPFRAGVKVPKEGAQPAPEEETDVIDPEGVKKARESAIKEQNRTTRKKLTVPLGGTLGAGSGLGIG